MLKNYVVMGILNICALFLLALGVKANQNEVLVKRGKKYYILCIFLTIIIILSELGTCFFDNSAASLRYLSIICNCIGFILSPLVPMSMSETFCQKRDVFTKLCYAVICINTIMCILSVRFNFIFYVSEQNTYSRGSFFFVFTLSYLICVFALLRITLLQIEKYSSERKIAYVLLLLFAVVGTSVQVIEPVVHSTWSCVTLALILYYLFICEVSNKYDVLTETLNRRTYENDINDITKLCRVTVALFDIDDFKKMNDEFGHQYGDICLKNIASCIKNAFGKKGTCYRIGGDEFCVISKTLDNNELTGILNCLTNNLEKCREKDSKMPFVSFGYKIVQYDENISFAEIFNEADKNLYATKKKRKKDHIEMS